MEFIRKRTEKQKNHLNLEKNVDKNMPFKTQDKDEIEDIDDVENIFFQIRQFYILIRLI